MKFSLLLLLSAGLAADCFTVPTTPATKKSTRLNPIHMKEPRGWYVPGGFTPEGWAAFKGAEKRDHAKKKTHFQSRSLVDYQRDLEAGKVRHLFPVMFAKERIQSKQLRPSDVPYEQRQGGKYDNRDVNVGYVPSGMSVHEWHEFQRAEKNQRKTKNFAAFGPTSFKSRSLQGFQEDLEKGKSKHLFPAMYAKERLKQGRIKAEDIPYMQRGGSWDNSDVKGATNKKEWSETDKKMKYLPSWLRRGASAP